MQKTISGLAPAVILILFIGSAQAKPLDLQMGSRGYGMGGAYAAISDDATSIYWNPAGMVQVRSITLSETNWFLQDVSGVNVNYFAGLAPVGTHAAVGGGWFLQYAGLEQGEPGTSQYSQSNWFEHSFSLAGAIQLWEELAFFKSTSLGVSLNRHVLTSGSVNGAGTGFDLGFMTHFPHGVSLGLVARSLGADMMGDKIDPEYRVGLGYGWASPTQKHKVTVAIDGATKHNVEYLDGVDGVSLNLKGLGGAEYAYYQDEWFVALRGGANGMVFNSRETENHAVTGGFGAGFRGIMIQYAFHYSLDQVISLGRSHRMTFELDLGRFLKESNP